MKPLCNWSRVFKQMAYRCLLVPTGVGTMGKSAAVTMILNSHVMPLVQADACVGNYLFSAD